MTNEQRRAARVSFCAEVGDARLDEDDVQRDLDFNKTGNAIFDRLLAPPLEYLYPSPLGSLLFFAGASALGELALTNMLLSREREPVVLDYGAGVGVHAAMWAAAHPAGRFFAFESSPLERALLERNAARVGGQLIVAGDGETGGKASAIDRFVERTALPRVTAIRFASGWATLEALEAASTTLEAMRPALLVELGGDGIAREAAERIIAAIVERGYKPFVIVDGFVAPYKRYERALSTYLFIDARLRVMLPPYPGPESMLSATASRLTEIANLRSEVARLRARDGAVDVPTEDELERTRNLEEKVKNLEAVCDERLRVIVELNGALSRERRRSTPSAEGAPPPGDIESLRAENTMLRGVCDERAALIERLAGELRSANVTAEERLAGVARLVRELRETRETIEAVRAHVDVIASL